MDLLDNIATELGFEFHLYVVRDELFGSKQKRKINDFIRNKKHPLATEYNPQYHADRKILNEEYESRKYRSSSKTGQQDEHNINRGNRGNIDNSHAQRK